MATYQDFSLIKKEVEFIKKRNELDTLSKSLIFLVLEKFYLDIDPMEFITDGGRDFSIDAYYIDEMKETINIFQFKHTDSFETSKNKMGLKEKEWSDLIIKMQSIWDKDESIIKKVNKNSKEAIREIWSAFEKGFSKTNIWLITNYQKTFDDTHIDEAREKVKKDFKAEIKILSLDDLAKLIVGKDFSPVNVDLKLKGKNYFEDSTGDIRALISEVNAQTFLESILDVKSKKIKEEVFNENVRVYLRADTKINKQICESIKSQDNYKFFYYNNGITAICDSFEHNNSDSPIVKLKNFQIVNGGQTMHSIYEIYKSEFKNKIENIYLLIRIYEVKNREVGQAVARFTNTQNPVKNRDIMSNDQVQIKLQKELLREKFYYERKKYEFRDQNIKVNQKIDAEKIGQAILAFYLDKPGSAKNKKQEIFGDYYNDVFAEDKINAEYVLVPYLIHKKIEQDIKKFSVKVKKLEKGGEDTELKKLLQKDEFLGHAHYYLLFVLGEFARKDNLSLERKNISKIFKSYNKAKNLLRSVIDNKKNKPKFSLPYIFKSDDLVEEIRV